MARLDRLMTGKVIAQLGATMGRQFSYALLQAVVQLNERTLHEELHRLVEAELLYQRGLPPQAHYVFKHALIQDAAYESLLKSTRQQYHQRIAHVLEAQFSETAEAQPELLAHHYTEAGLNRTGGRYWYQAGQSAAKRSAHAEAINHLRQGLQLLQTLPETSERTQREIDMHIALGASLIATKGYGAREVGETYTHARQLCATPRKASAAFSGTAWTLELLSRACRVSDGTRPGRATPALAQQVHDPAMLCAAHRALGETLFHLGAVAAAHTHLTQGMALHDPQRHRASAFLYGDDAGVVCHSRAAWTLWLLGYPDQGLVRSDETVTLAQQVAHPFSLNFALGGAAVSHQFRREGRAAQECAEAPSALPRNKDFRTGGRRIILRGWALAHQGQAKEGIEQIHQGLIAWRATGAEILRPYWLALLAEAHGTIGEPEIGLTALAEALTLVDTTGERWYEAELYRLKGALLLQQSFGQSG